MGFKFNALTGNFDIAGSGGGGGGGVDTVGSFSASAQTNGATISGSTITFGPASATVPGMVGTGAQTWAGAKTFNAAPVLAALTATTVPYLDGSKVLTSSAVTPTELGYLSGVTSAIQTQLNAKQATGNFATSGSGDVAWSAPSGAGPVTTTYSGTVPLNKGGTGQTTKAPAFNALSPMTTAGDIIIGGASGTGTRLAAGTDTYVLTMTSGSPAWAAPTSGSTFAGAINLNNVSPITSTNTATSKNFIFSELFACMAVNALVTPAPTTGNTYSLWMGTNFLFNSGVAKNWGTSGSNQVATAIRLQGSEYGTTTQSFDVMFGSAASPGNNSGFSSGFSLTNSASGTLLTQALFSIDQLGSQVILKFGYSSGGVNQLLCTNASGILQLTGGSSGSVRLETGSTTHLQAFSTSSVRIGKASLATNATDGWPYIPATAGSPSGTPTSISSFVPIQYDTTNNKLWVYDTGAGAWKGIVLL